MGVSILPERKDGEITIKVSGELTFNLQREFREAYEGFGSKERIKIDLSDTTYIDSAGLGILMAMRLKLGGDASRIELCRCKRNVRELMDIFRLDQYFRIS